MPKYVGRSKSSETTRISLWIYDGIISNLVQETAEDGMAGLQSKFQNLNKKVHQG